MFNAGSADYRVGEGLVFKGTTHRQRTCWYSAYAFLGGTGNKYVGIE